MISFLDEERSSDGVYPYDSYGKKDICTQLILVVMARYVRPDGIAVLDSLRASGRFLLISFLKEYVS